MLAESCPASLREAASVMTQLPHVPSVKVFVSAWLGHMHVPGNQGRSTQHVGNLAIGARITPK